MPWENVYRTDEVYGGFGHLEIKRAHYFESLRKVVLKLKYDFEKIQWSNKRKCGRVETPKWFSLGQMHLDVIHKNRFDRSKRGKETFGRI